VNKVEVTQFGIIHCIARCDQCSFEEGYGYHAEDRQQTRNAVRSHVLKTGHTVNIETGNATKYSLVLEGKDNE